MNKLTKILSVLMVAIMLTVAISPAVNASLSPNSVQPNQNSTANNKILDVGGSILGIVRAVAVVAAVVIIAVLGVKYIVGSTEEKANYKKAFMPYIIGILLVVAASQIATWIWDFGNNSIK